MPDGSADGASEKSDAIALGWADGPALGSGLDDGAILKPLLGTLDGKRLG